MIETISKDNGKVCPLGGANASVGFLAGDGAGLEPSSAMSVPETYRLDSNYPNPFNPETVIRFALPEAVHVRLTIYDVLGRNVAILVDGEKPAGRHSVTWNAEGVSSGTYLYRIEAGSFAETRTMLLLK